MARITAILMSGMAVQLSNGRHEWKADEPLSAGGSDTGPNPYELLLGSLAACTCITISWYCHHKGLPATISRVSTLMIAKTVTSLIRDISKKLPATFISRAISMRCSASA